VLRTFFVTRDGYGELLDGPKKILVESDESHLWLMVPEIPTIEDPMGTRVLLEYHTDAYLDDEPGPGWYLYIWVDGDEADSRKFCLTKTTVDE